MRPHFCLGSTPDQPPNNFGEIFRNALLSYHGLYRVLRGTGSDRPTMFQVTIAFPYLQ